MKKILVCGLCTKDIMFGTSYFGGAAGGMALNLGRLGFSVGLLSVLGNDVFSETYEQKLRDSGVDLSLVIRKKGPLSALRVVSEENSESAREFESNGVPEFLAAYKPDKVLLNSFDMLYVVNVQKKLCDYLAGTFTGEVSYCPGSFLVRDPASLSLDLVRISSYIFVNKQEYEILAKLCDIQSLFAHNLKYLFVTCGEDGVDVYSSQAKKHYDSQQPTKIIDTTGAGDAFACGVLSLITQNKDIEQAVSAGIEYAILCIQKPGVAIE